MGLCSYVLSRFSCVPMDSSLPGSSVYGILQARILEWVAYSFSSVSSWLRNRVGVSFISGRFFTNWAIREAPTVHVQFSSVTQSCPTLCDPMDCQDARLPCPSTTQGAYSYSCPLSQWCHPTISSSVVPFSSRLLSFPASGSFPMSWFLASSGQSIGVSASASVLPMSIQNWFPLGWTGWISLLAKGLSRAFSDTTVQKHQFFGA